MPTEYLTEDRKPQAAGDAARPGTLFAGLAALLLAACSSSSSDSGPPPSPPPPTNAAPTAAAGPDMTVSTTIGVQLDGTASSDADGDALTYAWSFALVPSGSTAAFDDDVSAQPSFTPDVAGDYTIELVVSDGTATSSADQIVVTAADNTVMQTIGSAGGRLVSSDGLLSVDIPAGALPADEDISVTFVPAAQRAGYLGDLFDGIEFDMVYDLGPDGTTFAEPVTVTAAIDENPVMAADTIGSGMHFMFTENGSAIEALQNQRIVADADNARLSVSGTLDHFSPALIKDGNEAFTWAVTGIPDRMESDQYTTAQVTVESPGVAVDSALFTNYTFVGINFRPAPGFQGVLDMLRQGQSNDFMLEVDYLCEGQGTDELRSYITVVIGDVNTVNFELFPQQLLDSLRDAQEFTAQAVKSVECVLEPQAEIRMNPGLFAVPFGMTGVETVQALRLGPLTFDGAASGPSDPMLLIAGGRGSVLFNQRSGEAVYNSLDPSRGPLLGALLAYADNPAGGTAGMVYEHALGNLGANRRCDYDFSIRAFGTFCFGINGAGYDASLPIGSTANTPEALFVTSTRIDWLKLDPDIGTYDFGSAYSADFADFSGTPVSAAGNGSTRSALVVTNDAPDFSTLSQVGTAGQVTLHDAFFGEDFRKVRCIQALCGITVFDDGTGSGAVRMVSWDGDNAPTPVADPIGVGDGPVGLVPLDMGDGTALWGISAFDGNTITLIHSMMTGEAISTYTAPAPGGCDGPAHLDFYVPPGADPSEAQLVGTCFRSNQYFVTDIVLDSAQGFVFVDPTTTP